MDLAPKIKFICLQYWVNGTEPVAYHHVCADRRDYKSL